MFCPKCGSLLMPKRESGRLVVACSCGYRGNAQPQFSLKERTTEHQHIHVVEKEEEGGKALVDEKCPTCGHHRAYTWEVQMRAADEPATTFFKCESCKHTWRRNK